MCLDDGGGDRQAEPGPAGLGCPVGAEPLEWLEQPLDLCGGHRGSGVSHPEECVPVRGSGHHLDVAPWLVVAQGVVGEVGYQSFGKTGIACDRGGNERGGNVQCQGLCALAARVEHPRRDVGQIEGLPVVQAALAAGEGEQRFDQLFLLLAYREHFLAGRTQRHRCGTGVGEGHLEHGALQGERGAQLVGGVGDKLPLGVERGLQPGEQAVDGVGQILKLVPSAGHGHVSLTWPSGSWAGGNLGGEGGPGNTGFSQAAGTFTITGSGDIAPAVSGGGGVGVTVAQTLVGTFAGLIVLAVVGAMFMTAEYRRHLIRVTLTAAPRRGRVLAAKAVVVGAVTFAAGLVSAAIAVVLGQRILRGNGAYVYPASALTQVRVIAGTAAVLAVTTVIALAIGTILRRGAGAVAVVVVVIVLPYLFTVAAPILPAGPAGWLLRVTPAAAFAVQQTLIQYPQVTNTYTAAYGYYPLPPWAGLTVLCAWAALALGLGVFLLRRRDA